MKRVFDIDTEDILKIHFVDWRGESFTSTKKDTFGLREHPVYGIDITHFKNKLFFSATEYAHREGGYLEGALIRAKEVAKVLTNQ